MILTKFDPPIKINHEGQIRPFGNLKGQRVISRVKQTHLRLKALCNRRKKALTINALRGTQGSSFIIKVGKLPNKVLQLLCTLNPTKNKIVQLKEVIQILQ
jgi:hypothetical protein